MVRKPLPPLNAVRAFEAAARLGSYVAAAAELHVTQPAIGRHVKNLEAFLNSRLFERTPRGVVLTAAGACYFELVNKALTLLSDASLELVQPIQANRLHVLAVPGFANRWLLRHLSEFRELHPSIRLTIESNSSFKDLASSKADLGIVFGIAEEFSGPVKPLATPAIFPVCTPEFVAKFGPFMEPAELLRVPLLHEDDGYWWRSWFRSQQVNTRLHSEIAYTSADQLLDLAQAGLGMALTNALLVEQALESGQLIRPLPHTSILEGYFLLQPAAGLSPQARIFCEWLTLRISECLPAAI